MMLEAGKSYRSIDDTVHGPLERRDVPPDTTTYVFIDPKTGHTWTAEGRWSTDARTDKDLIAEVPAPTRATPPMSDAEMQGKLAITAGIGGQTFADLVRAEVERARTLHPTPYASAHEAFAVLLEEVDELWDEVKRKQSAPGRRYNMAKELVQVAAVCQRFADEVIRPEAAAKPAREDGCPF